MLLSFNENGISRMQKVTLMRAAPAISADLFGHRNLEQGLCTLHNGVFQAVCTSTCG